MLRTSVRVGLAVMMVSVATVESKPKTIKTSGPDPIFKKPAPITMAQLGKLKVKGVQAVEVSDYMFGDYKGQLKPSPPHADHNPQKAILIVWENNPNRFVFWHEASYCPWLELPSGAGPCFQFFEANLGSELFNNQGRKERNSFVDIIESGPQRVWVRWTYFSTDKESGEPALRGTEDFMMFPNGLIWRRQSYQSLQPDSGAGYSIQPLDFFSVIPRGVHYSELLPKDKTHGDYMVAAVVDAYSAKQYNVYWDKSDKATCLEFHAYRGGEEVIQEEFYARRTGAQHWKDLMESPGKAVVQTFKDGLVFCALGDSSGFPHEMTQILDESHPDTGSWNWGNVKVKHWPIGYVNAQVIIARDEDIEEYPYHICPMSLFLVKDWFTGQIELDQYLKRVNDIEQVKWTEQSVFYTMIGVGNDFSTIRSLSRQWLDKGKACATPDSVADLKP